MRIACVGATGAVGKVVIGQLSGRGHEVSAIPIHLDAVEELPGVTAVAADANDGPALTELISGHDVVVTSIQYSKTDPDTLIEAVKASGVPRYVVAGGVGHSARPGHHHPVFTDVRVPKANLLVKAGRGFEYLIRKLAQERMQIAVASRARAGLSWTIDYVRDHTAFGQPIGRFQHSRSGWPTSPPRSPSPRRSWTAASRAQRGRLTLVDAAKPKLWATEMEWRTLDACLQLFGGYGFMLEYPVARAAVDARVHGGTSEIMREITGRDLRLG
jgi:alkylation response protein AidB-like acyl-CoA dehydrogenase